MGALVGQPPIFGLLGHALSDLTGEVGRVELGHERVDALHETSGGRLLDVLGAAGSLVEREVPFAAPQRCSRGVTTAPTDHRRSSPEADFPVHRHRAFPLALSSLDAGRFRNRVHMAMRQARCDRAIDVVAP
jgi:hypothetical protein